MSPSNDPPVGSEDNTYPALQQLQRLYQDSEAEILILTGSAGTGKTTLVGQLVRALHTRGQRTSLLATTGRAAKILTEKTGVQASTIHSAIYHFNALKGMEGLEDDAHLSMDKAGQLYLQFDLKFSLFHDEDNPHIFIVDESSMLTHERNLRDHTAKFGSGSLLDDFIHFASRQKVLFVGDPCQLPPISDNPTSSALDPYFLADRYDKQVGIIELTRVWRQAEGNEILDIATWFRDRIMEKRAFKGIKIPPPEGRHVHVVPTLDDLVDGYVATLGSPPEYNKATLIAQSNKMAGELNARVRQRMGFGDKASVGELLSVVQNSYTTPLMNGDLVVIEEIQPGLRRAGLQFMKVTVRALHSGQLFTTLMINDLLFNAESSLNKEDAGALLMDFIIRMRERDIKPNTRAFTLGLRSDPYLNALRCKFGYALTAHKSQGGEWDDVFLALGKSLGSLPGEGAARWYYTAFTRARERVYLNAGPWIESDRPKVRVIHPKSFKF